MVTKRQLGLLLLAAGLGVLALVFSLGILRTGQWTAMGPYRQIAAMAGAALSLVGVSLLPLGNRPA